MKCAVHSEVDATGYCRNCGKPMCPACIRPVRDVLYCEDCLATILAIPLPLLLNHSHLLRPFHSNRKCLLFHRPLPAASVQTQL